jgi:hypothetical protein
MTAAFFAKLSSSVSAIDMGKMIGTPIAKPLEKNL